MPTVKYRPYYKYKPTISNLLVDELSQEEVERNLRLLSDDLDNYFDEVEGAVLLHQDGVITITSYLTEKECDQIVAARLSALHLFADKISE